MIGIGHKMNVAKLSDLLDSYNGRDKILRLLYYSINSISGLCSQPTSSKLNKLSTHIDNCRTFLRLFDDIPMLNYTLSYGSGKQEPDELMRVCGVAINAFDQLYYPLEHVAWAADNGLIRVDSSHWWNASTVCWVASLYLSLCKSFRYFAILQTTKRCQNISSVQEREMFKQLSKAQLQELLTMIRCISDLTHAVHWLPTGVLWSGKLKTWQIGVLGTVSSLITLYQTIVQPSKDQ